jgi:predicted DNA-binding protein YlxM (UPF0122 family)
MDINIDQTDPYATLQLEIHKNIQLANEQFDKIEMKLQVEVKNVKLTRIRRNIIKNDIARVRAIKKQLRDLECMDTFYRALDPLNFNRA